MILVTGASGLVGSYVCRKLHQEGFAFRALIRERSSLQFLNDIPDSCFVKGDIMDPLSLDLALEGVTTIMHSAAVVSFDPGDAKWMNKVNVEGTKNLIDAALNKGVDKFIHISSISATGLNKEDRIVDENAKWPGTIIPTNYGISKYLAELEVWRGSLEGLNVTILAPSTVMGPGDWERSSPKLYKYVYDEKMFYTTGELNYVDLRDLTEIIMHFIKNEAKNEKYLVSAGNIKFYDFFQLIGKNLGKKAPTIKATPFLIYVAVFSEWLKSKFTGKAPLVSLETARRGSNSVLYDNTKILNEINFNFQSIEESVKWTCDELMKHYEN